MWNDLGLIDKARMMQLAVRSGITDLRTIEEVYNTYASGGPLKSNYTLPAIIVTPDKEYSQFLNTLPDNQKFTPESEYSTKKYWELNGKPKDFEEAKKLGMYVYDSSDNLYHANSIAWGDDGIGYFMKPKHHDTVKYELDWFNNGIVTEEGGRQHKAFGNDLKEWEEFRKNYDIDTTGNFYKYIPKQSYSLGGKIHIKPQNRGKFTALKKRTGKSASWFKAHGTPAQKKMATFALNARKWKHEDGGPLGTGDEEPLEFLGPSRGEYLSQVYKDYFTNFKNYDDFNNRAVIPDESKAMYNAMAQYYYNNDPNYASYFKLIQGPYKTYTDLRNKYEKDENQMVDLTSGNSYKLSSLGPNNKPTNKHGMRISENLLNYIYDSASQAGVDPKTAIALAVNESNLGNARAKNGKVGLFDLYSYWAGTDSVIYPNSKTTEPLRMIMNKVNSGGKLTNEDREALKDLYIRYDTMANSIHPYRGNNVVADAVKYFNEDNYVGRALPEETKQAYRDLVMSRFDELMNDQRFRTWWENKK